ncbi:Vps4 oligomerisation, C-terminal [Lasallia pustulata]|uniref:Vps4 oligomerisation, C-terminal n=1 Tax=Lasallia pustulata TaxID=136370 RepID=A0A1W5D1L3_9LECA|nr:Vps4 oligomerisation, C-terminal [Lasallia pustulata]
MRTNTASSMQKTYDDCYLICSTAIYFEGQDNEAEALRSWHSALDQIYYHNAYRVPQNYQPKSETEKALQESLKDMEMQCKERVDLLEALRRSREEVKGTSAKPKDGGTMRGRSSLPKTPKESIEQARSGYIGQGTVNYPDLSKPAPPPKPAPPLPQRPTLGVHQSSDSRTPRSYSIPQVVTTRPSATYSPPSLAGPRISDPRTSRTPSPEKKSRLLTTLRTNKDGKRPSKPPRTSSGRNSGPPTASKAAGLAWDTISRSYGNKLGQSLPGQGGSTVTVNSARRDSSSHYSVNKIESSHPANGDSFPKKSSRSSSVVRPDSPLDSGTTPGTRRPNSYHAEDAISQPRFSNSTAYVHQSQTIEDLITLEPPTPPTHSAETKNPVLAKSKNQSPGRAKPPIDYLSYRSEYPPASLPTQFNGLAATSKPNPPGEPANSYKLPTRQRSPQRKTVPGSSPAVTRRLVSVANISSPRANRQVKPEQHKLGSSDSGDENTSSSREAESTSRRVNRKRREVPMATEVVTTPSSTDRDSSEVSASSTVWEERVKYIQKHLPPGVDANAAKQIFNEIVVRGDEVHWDDVAGLDIAKNALKEAVVYPFLRPDLFMGLREPARGMLLFGPPGTGKTMLARAVATESRSTFFAISASSLTSKWLGESEKLVRALFSLAKALAPSIIFVDEIDSLLSSRGGSSEHESTRRIKTEFLIQWSDLQRAAAGREQTEKEKKEGDASRVLVLAATNLPWAIDEAARRRFVRRQYIPLPEASVRATQLRTLLGHQKHSLDRDDIEVLVRLTEGFSGSDITALAKDAAMGPLRSLGEALLHMSMDDIRPIQFQDFEASLINIRPSVSKQGLKEFEDWAREFGERGG